MKIEAFFIILRRKNSKIPAITYLKKLILNEADQIVISYIFRGIHQIYCNSFKDKLKKLF